jgi:hypothetical protein
MYILHLQLLQSIHGPFGGQGHAVNDAAAASGQQGSRVPPASQIHACLDAIAASLFSVLSLIITSLSNSAAGPR